MTVMLFITELNYLMTLECCNCTLNTMTLNIDDGQSVELHC